MGKKPQLGVLGFVDDAHAALAELLGDVIVRDRLANHGVSPSAAQEVWAVAGDKIV